MFFWPANKEYITDNQDHETIYDDSYGVISKCNDDNSWVRKSKDPFGKELIGDLDIIQQEILHRYGTN